MSRTCAHGLSDIVALTGVVLVLFTVKLLLQKPCCSLTFPVEGKSHMCLPVSAVPPPHHVLARFVGSLGQ